MSLEYSNFDVSLIHLNNKPFFTIIWNHIVLQIVRIKEINRTIQLHNLFMLWCMLEVLYYCFHDALWHCHHCWDSCADSWCLCVSQSTWLFGSGVFDWVRNETFNNTDISSAYTMYYIFYMLWILTLHILCI